MKQLTDFISESLIVEAKKSTLKDYIMWHYELNNENDFTFDKFNDKDFDAKALNKYFDGDKKKMYDEIVNLMKNDKLINIDSSWRGDDVLTKFKADKYTFNALSNLGTKWAPEYAFGDSRSIANEDESLTYSNQLTFKKWATNKMQEEGLIDKALEKFNCNRRSYNFRSGGLFSFDHVHAYNSIDKRQATIDGLVADGSMTFKDAYDVLVKYFK